MLMLEERIVNRVSECGGCKLTDVAPDLIDDLKRLVAEQDDGWEEAQSILNDDLADDIVSAIERLIAAKQLVEVEFFLPGTPHRVKSFLLPKGSTLIVKPAEATEEDANND